VVRRAAIWKSLGLAIIFAAILAGCSTPAQSVRTTASTFRNLSPTPKIILNVATYSRAIAAPTTSPHGVVTGRA
jgi:hypothetical protein